MFINSIWFILLPSRTHRKKTRLYEKIEAQNGHQSYDVTSRKAPASSETDYRKEKIRNCSTGGHSSPKMEKTHHIFNHRLRKVRAAAATDDKLQTVLIMGLNINCSSNATCFPGGKAAQA
jgi:hypothetical protein